MKTSEDASEFSPRRGRSHRDLIVWRKAIDLAVEAYKLAASLPDDECDILKERMYRASVLISSNIAEGHDLSTKAFLRHLDVAQGSLAQLVTMLELAKQLGYFDESMVSKAKLLADEVGRLLWTLMDKLGAQRWD
jgi:four helix bundle protein